MSHKLNMILEKRANKYYAYCPEIENSHKQGDSLKEVINDIQETIENYLETTSEPAPNLDDRSIWEVCDEIMKDLPISTLEQLPIDGAEQHDHYIYGIPKQSK